MDISLVVTDLDGTLLSDHSNISKNDLKAIDLLHEKGIPLAFATGRVFEGTISVVEKYNLEEKVSYLIHTGGVYTYDIKEKKEYAQKLLMPEEMKFIYNKFKRFNVPLFFVEDDTFCTSHINERVLKESKVYNCDIKELSDFENALTKPLSKIIYCGEDENFENLVKETMKESDRYCDFFRSHEFYLDCNAKGVNKGESLKKLCERKKIDINKTIALGDNFNDLDMLKVAGKSGCPSTAHDDIKKIVDFISTPCYDGAFSNFVNHFINL